MTGLYHGWDGDKDTHADFVHGGVPIDDFEDLVPYRKKRGKAKPKKKRGCPENDFKAHVYIWVEEKWYRRKYNHTNGWWVEDKSSWSIIRRKTCCGCGHVTNSKYDWTTYYA